MSGAEDIVSGFKDKLKNLDEIRKRRNNIGRECEGKVGYHQKGKSSNYRRRGVRRIPGQWSVKDQIFNKEKTSSD